jgi:hypothetical protein
MNPIEAFAAKIQALPPRVRWLSAQQDIVMGLGTPPHRGRGGVLADRAISWSCALELDRPLVAAANLALLLRLFIEQYLTKSASKPDVALFVGIRALREPPSVEQFESICGRTAEQLDERDLKTFFAFQRVALTAIVSEWMKVWAEIWSELSRSHPRYALDRSLRLSFLLRMGHKYIYLRAWFRRYLRLRGCDLPIGFSASSYTAAAAIAMGAKAIHFQHGFQRRSIVYPDFAEVHSFNRFEAEHFQARLPSSTVVIRPDPIQFVETQRLVAISGIYGEINDFDLCRSFIEWAQRRELPLVIRPHPQDFSGYWKQWAGVAGIDFMEERCDFDAFLQKVRPRFLVSWFSTSLFDALKRGSVPIALTKRAEVDDVVFPFLQVALRWPDDRGIVERLLDDRQACADLAAQKYAEATTFPPSKKLGTGG